MFATFFHAFWRDIVEKLFSVDVNNDRWLFICHHLEFPPTDRRQVLEFRSLQVHEFVAFEGASYAESVHSRCSWSDAAWHNLDVVCHIGVRHRNRLDAVPFEPADNPWVHLGSTCCTSYLVLVHGLAATLVASSLAPCVPG